METIIPELLTGIITSSPIAAVLFYIFLQERKDRIKKDDQLIALTERIITAMNNNTDSSRELRHALQGHKE